MRITEHLPSIVKLIAEKTVVSIVAPTGSGKSTAVPAAIAQLGVAVFIVVPTRNAAISLAGYQKELQRIALASQNVTDAYLDSLVGYAAEGDVKYNDTTKIVYCTGGHMRRKLLRYFKSGVAEPMNFCQVLMVDEVHAQSLDTTMILSLWYTAYSQQKLVPRLVVASATPIDNIIPLEQSVYTVDIKGYPIDIRYHTRDYDVDEETLYTDTATVASDFHRTVPIEDGHMMIFAPGSREVELIMTKLKDLPKASVIPAFGALHQQDIARIYETVPADVRKIIVATNIAEMSITIDNLGVVVDTMTEKQAETSNSGGPRLVTHYISRDSAKQRTGRTGRTRPGISYRMTTEAAFVSERFTDHRTPEVDRVPIYEAMMELLAVGLVPENTIVGIDKNRITKSFELLTKLGMIQTENKEIKITPIGQFAPKFPISVRNSAFLYNWLRTELAPKSFLPAFPGIVVACLIDAYGPSFFWYPRKGTDMSNDEYSLVIKEHRSRYFTKFIGDSDLESCLNMFSDMMVNAQNPVDKFSLNMNKVATWARDNSINMKKIRELILIIEQSINTILATKTASVSIAPFTTAGVMKAAQPLLSKTYSDRILTHSRDQTYYDKVTREDYRLESRESVNNLKEKRPSAIVALVSMEIRGASRPIRIVSMAIPADVSVLPKPEKREVLASKSMEESLNILAKMNLGTKISVKSAVNYREVVNAFNLLNSVKPRIQTLTTTIIERPEVAPNEIPLTIQTVEYGGKSFNLIQDHYLTAGTKQRGLVFFQRLKANGFTELVTYGTPYGYGQIAVSYACQYVGLKATVFLEKVVPPTELTGIARSFGGNIVELDSNLHNYQKAEAAKAYATEVPSRYFMNLGLDDQQFIEDLASGINHVKGNLNPRRIWVAGGSLVLTRALAKVFPQTEFNIVQTGRDLRTDLLVGVKYKVWISQQPFKDAVLPGDEPPYESLANYDAKVWQFVSKYGQTGDYIWNVK